MRVVPPDRAPRLVLIGRRSTTSGLPTHPSATASAAATFAQPQYTVQVQPQSRRASVDPQSITFLCPSWSSTSSTFFPPIHPPPFFPPCSSALRATSGPLPSNNHRYHRAFPSLNSGGCARGKSLYRLAFIGPLHPQACITDWTTPAQDGVQSACVSSLVG